MAPKFILDALQYRLGPFAAVSTWPWMWMLRAAADLVERLWFTLDNYQLSLLCRMQATADQTFVGQDLPLQHMRRAITSPFFDSRDRFGAPILANGWMQADSNAPLWVSLPHERFVDGP